MGRDSSLGHFTLHVRTGAARALSASSLLVEPQIAAEPRARTGAAVVTPLRSRDASPAKLEVAAATGRKPALPALSGLRTLLAIGILLFHFTPPHVDWLHPIIDNSFIFVGTFFLISGFILTYNYADRAHTMVKRDFWLARFARLYPTYAFVLLLSIPMLLGEWQARSHAEFWAGLVLTPLLLQGWSPQLATFWNTVAWTLSADLLLYLMFPYVLKAAVAESPWVRRPWRLLLVIAALWAIGIAPHTWYHFANPDHLPGPADRYTMTTWMRVLRYTPFAYVCTFLAGMALGRLHALVSTTARQRAAMAGLAVAALLSFFYLFAPHLPYVIVHGALLLPLFCLLVMGLSGPSPAASVFGVRPLVLVGEATFALYLLHFNLFEMIHNYHWPERLHVAALDPWISYVAIIGFALLTVRLLEKPANRVLLNRFHSKARGKATISAASI